MSECKYLTFKFASSKYSVKSSAIFFVRVVTKTLWDFSIHFLHSFIKSSTCEEAGFISHIGSVKPVGLTTCSIIKLLDSFISHSPGVADTNTVLGLIFSHSSNFNGLLSKQDGSLKPYSDRFDFLE